MQPLKFVLIAAHLWGVGLDGVVNVDEDKKDGDEQGHPEPQVPTSIESQMCHLFLS
jgi:hypothetical protein